jgi:hypothetical protein
MWKWKNVAKVFKNWKNTIILRDCDCNIYKKIIKLILNKLFFF